MKYSHSDLFGNASFESDDPTWRTSVNPEHERLKEAVLIAAREWRQIQNSFHSEMETEVYEAAMERYDAIEAEYEKSLDALIEFEQGAK